MDIERMDIERLVAHGIGINTHTYYEFMYFLYSGDVSYGTAHIAVFGMN